MEGTLFGDRCGWIGGCGGGNVWHFSFVASTFAVKWKQSFQLKVRQGKKIMEDWKENVVYDTHLKGHKSELIRGVWYNCLGYQLPWPGGFPSHIFPGLQAQSERRLDFTRIGFC